MTTVVYADVLVALNIFITYILLVCARLMLKAETKRLAVVAASFIGGFSAAVIFLDDKGVLFSACFKLITGAVIASAAFLPKSLKQFVKSVFAFFAVSFIFGGAMFAVELAVPNAFVYKNGAVYFDVSIVFIVTASVIIYALFRAGDYFLRRRAADNTVYKLRVYFRGSCAEMKALSDTGNSLTDACSSRPVIVAESKSLTKLFTYEELKYFKLCSVTADVPRSLKTHVRIIPCRGIGGSNVLMGFVPEKAVISDGKSICVTECVTVAVTGEELSGGEYGALLNAQIFERSKITDEITLT